MKLKLKANLCKKSVHKGIVFLFLIVGDIWYCRHLTVGRFVNSLLKIHLNDFIERTFPAIMFVVCFFFFSFSSLCGLIKSNFNFLPNEVMQCKKKLICYWRLHNISHLTQSPKAPYVHSLLQQNTVVHAIVFFIPVVFVIFIAFC